MIAEKCDPHPAYGDTLTRFWTLLYHEMVTAWRVGALVNCFQGLPSKSGSGR